MTIEAMKQALAVLEEIADEVSSPYDNKLGDAILALRAAIEQTKKPHRWQRLTEEEIARRESVNPIRVRIMQEAYDLADRDDSEGYNSVKVMCSEVLSMIDRLLDERQPEQEPVAWMYHGIRHDNTPHERPSLIWKPEYMDAMSAEKGVKAIPLYAAPRSCTAEAAIIKESLTVQTEELKEKNT